MAVENYEPIAWAEELIEPTKAVDHPRLAALYVMASQCYLAGRREAAARYADDAGQMAMRSGRDEVPYGIHGLLGAAYVGIGQPERWVECVAPSLHVVVTHSYSRGHAWSSR
jgi:hypothetical protein